MRKMNMTARFQSASALRLLALMLGMSAATAAGQTAPTPHVVEFAPATCQEHEWKGAVALSLTCTPTIALTDTN